MSRGVAGRLVFSGRLQVKTPLHVGGLGGAGEPDLPLATNGAGQYYIPGTSLAGALRAWYQRALGEKRDLWGAGPKEGAETSGHASWIAIADALVAAPKEGEATSGAKDGKPRVQAEIRDGIGIDRVTGTAADTIKFERMVLPRGTLIPLDITLDVPGRDNPTFGMTEALADLAAMVSALEDERIRFGAAKTRGLGRVSLCRDWCLAQYDLKTPGSLLNFLQKSPVQEWDGSIAGQSAELRAKAAQRRVERRLTLTLKWTPIAPVMVKSGAEAVSIDMVPLVTGDLNSGKVHFVLPGSSLKGALRSQAERILNTLCPPETSAELPDSDKEKKPKNKELFLHQIARQPLVEALFGAPGKRAKKAEGTDKQSEHDSKRKWEPGLGALSIDDCFAKSQSAISQAQWNTILTAVDPDKEEVEKTDASNGPEKAQGKDQNKSSDADNKRLKDAQKRYREHGKKFPSDADGVKLKPTYHVALDRWTGGAAEGFLYQVLEPHDVMWEPIRIELDFDRLPQHCHAPALALLLLVVRDMAEGWLPIGFGVNRGHGSFNVDGAELRGWAPIGADLADLQKEFDAKTLGGLDGWADGLTRDWKNFIAKGGACNADPA